HISPRANPDGGRRRNAAIRHARLTAANSAPARRCPNLSEARGQSVCIVHAADVPTISNCVNSGVATTIPSGRISQNNVKETMMKLKMLVTALLATFLGL